jgi:hypothetical protein
LGWVDFGLVKEGDLAALIALQPAVTDRYGGQVSKKKRSFASLLVCPGDPLPEQITPFLEKHVLT